MGVVGLASERERERERERDSVSLGGDIHKWIKRALVLYKHTAMTGDLCMEQIKKNEKNPAHNRISRRGIAVGTRCDLRGVEHTDSLVINK